MLLCDEVIATAEMFKQRPTGKHNDKSMSLRRLYGAKHIDFAERVKQAPRFIISDEVVEASCHVILSRPSSMREALKYVRVPYPRMWMEFLDAPRRLMREALHISHDNDRPLPIRFGFLIESDDLGRRGTVEFAWVHPRELLEQHYRQGNANIIGDPAVDELNMNICPVLTEFDLDLIEEGRGDAAVAAAVDKTMLKKWGSDPREVQAFADIDLCAKAMISPCGGPLFDFYYETGGLDFAKRLHAVAVSDIEGEVLQVLSLLVMMAARNGARVSEPVVLDKLNKARAKKHKPPLLDHRVVTMRLSPGERRAAGAGGTLTGTRRLHLVWGHYVVRHHPNEVIYWRRAHMRGSAKAGILPPRTTVVKI